MEAHKPFKSGIIAIWTHEPESGGIFEHSEIHTFGNEVFFTGYLIDDGSGESQIGQRFWFPVVNVTMVMEYDNLEQAVASRNEAENKD